MSDGTNATLVIVFLLVVVQLNRHSLQLVLNVELGGPDHPGDMPDGATVVPVDPASVPVHQIFVSVRPDDFRCDCPGDDQVGVVIAEVS